MASEKQGEMTEAMENLWRDEGLRPRGRSRLAEGEHLLATPPTVPRAALLR
ncbi:hypothetical protein ACIHIX_35050 [Streptomyces sp. NPDC051913]|uniref:hypothetical protein n=1 Tax=Streptomyces sp. NPDC051913 TaxID=3365676 RepID=UPI0037D3DB5C